MISPTTVSDDHLLDDPSFEARGIARIPHAVKSFGRSIPEDFKVTIAEVFLSCKRAATAFKGGRFETIPPDNALGRIYREMRRSFRDLAARRYIFCFRGIRSDAVYDPSIPDQEDLRSYAQTSRIVESVSFATKNPA